MEEKIAPLFYPDVLLPDQYWQIVCRRDLQPEKKLMLAALEDAIWTYRRYLPMENLLFWEVEGWFFGQDSDRIFSFENICDVLGLSPGHIRQRLLLWKENQAAQNRSILLSSKNKNALRNRTLSSPLWARTARERSSAAL